MWDVVVVGSVNADLVVGVERRPAPGETVLGSDLATHPGGKGANQAVAAARLGGRAGIVGRVGDDGHGALLRAALAADGVALDHLVTTPDAPTGVALITVGPDGDNSIIVSPGANARLGPGDVEDAREMIAGAAVVSFQLEVPLPAVEAAAGAAARAGGRVVLNLSPPAPIPDGLLALCDPLVVNEHEAAFLLGGDGDPARMAAALAGSGPRSVVVTLGADGVVVAGGGGTTALPSPKAKAVDTTGAGDAFTAALCLRLARGDALPDAAAYATRAGAAAVRRAGAQSSFPTPDELPGG
ncbi:ribokinase [Actinomadura madurae]|uniref:Ribokinase n=1 Tax=Actinomadura madurae TaxID=1993 RepID=A0A1I5AV03_9ACTN|nr:ribokinase [Actinomadura madurae]MCP9948587.1 ribokinase [Actinomadura madurae]MCP9965366.1 ribokinase [Actinomadura madurae]MCQ0010648.1 ribokinase [Actinomadura madurae]URM94233.1 ribokinase [Actinomadura madurae]URN04938.1 ribokinase [Actinomadura madurae]